MHTNTVEGLVDRVKELLWRAEKHGNGVFVSIETLRCVSAALSSRQGEAVAWLEWDGFGLAYGWHPAAKELPIGRYELFTTPPTDAVVEAVVEALERASNCLGGLNAQFDHAGCTCTFQSEDCCSFARSDAVINQATAALSHPSIAAMRGE